MRLKFFPGYLHRVSMQGDILVYSVLGFSSRVKQVGYIFVSSGPNSMTSIPLLKHVCLKSMNAQWGSQPLPRGDGKIRTNGCEEFPTLPVAQEDPETVH